MAAGKAGFVYENDGSPIDAGFFSSSGKRSFHHSCTSTSLRCFARRIGFCGVQPNSSMMRQTCAEGYEIPNSRRMTCATRGFIHTSLRKPYDFAPRCNNFGSFLRCSSLSLGLLPRPGWFRNASTLTAFPFWTHPLNVDSATPRASAIAFCLQPLSYNYQPRIRRASFQSCGFSSFFLMHPSNHSSVIYDSTAKTFFTAKTAHRPDVLRERTRRNSEGY